MLSKQFSYHTRISLCLHILLCIISVQTQEVVDSDTLIQVQVLFRHGERVPEYPYPTDPYNNDTIWEEGWGQLTDVGKGQEYALGQYLRTRYQNFLSDNYVPKEIYVISSAADRTIMSAELCLAGLYPTHNGTSNWNPNINWQPVPLHTIEAEEDNLLWLKRSCPRFQTELNDYLNNSPQMVKINQDNKEIFKALTDGSGVNITNIDKIDKFYATMMVEEMLGLELPKWAAPIVNTPNFQYLYNLSFVARSGTPELKRLRAGPLTEYLVHNIMEKVSNSSATNFFLLSGHDITLVAIMDTLGVLDLQRPYYSSAFMLELHQNPQSKDYFVQILLRNETDNEPYKLRLPGCDFKCPLQTFLDYTKPFIPEDWDTECQRAVVPVVPKTGHSILYFMIAVLIGVIICGLGVYLVILVLKRSRGGGVRTDYQQF